MTSMTWKIGMIKRSLKQCVIGILTSIFLFFTSCSIQADQPVLSLFPIEHYNQTTANWINPQSTDYDKPLISDAIQTMHMAELYKHYFGEKSPWNPAYVNIILHLAAPDDLISTEKSIINSFSNTGKSGPDINYGENYRPLSEDWLENIAANINIDSWKTLTYQDNHRAIAIDNLQARILPTDDVAMASNQYAGQGYPFDNLQISAVWIGTPLYVIAETQDQAWSLVITPAFIGWVKSNGVAYANTGVVNAFSNMAKNHLGAIIKTQTPIADKITHRFYASAYIGTIFPVMHQSQTALTLMIPVADENKNAVIKYVDVASDSAALMPYAPTPHHFADIINSLKGRPYGWGNMYFYNDCSGELKSLYTPFGIYLMRHSADQINAGKLVDESSASKEERLAYLVQHGHKLTTIIYLGGHVIMFAGNTSGVAMSYQDMWGLSPTADPTSRRSVVGESVFFPLLLQYPEDTTLHTQADKKYFQISFLDEEPTPTYLKFPAANLRVLMGMES